MKQEIKERVEKIHNGDVPEGYQKTKVGIIPVEWEVKKLAEVADVKTGPFGSALHEKDYVKNGTPIITVEHLGEQGVVHDNLPMVSDFDRNRLKSYVLKTGDIVFSRVGSVDRNSLVKETENGWLFSGRLLRIRVITANISPSYLSYHFHQEVTKQKIRSVAVGQTMASLNTQILKDIHVSFPHTRAEQQKIAEILSTWDKAIELKERLIEEKKELKIAIVNDLIFGLKRFDKFIKSHKYNHTKYINIPEDWGFIKIGEIATEVSKKNKNHDELPVLSCTKHSGLVDSLTYFKKRVFSKDTSTYKQVKKNQFVYATNHIDEGSIGCQNLYENSLVSPMYTVFKTNSKVNNDFLFSLLKTRLYIFIYQANMSASVDRRGSLRWNEFSKIHIPLPDIAEQNKIVEFIRLVDNEIELLNKELNQLKEQKRGLMQLLLTGIVRVEVD